MKKTKGPFDWSPTDALITSDEWDSIKYNLMLQLDELPDKKTFLANKDHSLAHAYLIHAEKIIRKRGAWSSSTSSLIRELRKAMREPEAWRIFMQTLLLITITGRAGDIPEMVHTAQGYKQVQSIKGSKPRKRNGVTPAEREIRNEKIIEHYQRTRLKPAGFAEKHAAKYGLKPRTVRLILKNAVGN